MRLQRKHLWVALVAALVAATAGSSMVATAATAPKVDRAAVLHFATSSAPSTWDPHTSANPGASRVYLLLVYDRLVNLRNDANGVAGIVPQLATSWTTSQDGLTMEFKLRSGLKFSDGTPFNAQAVQANINRAKTLAGSTAAPLLTSVDSVDVVNDTTVRFRLNKKDASLLYTLADVPGMMASPAAFGPGLTRTPVGIGPYKLTNVSATSAEFTRVDGYYDKDRGLAAQIQITAVPDITARYNLFKAGQADVIQLAPQQFADAAALQQSKQATFTIQGGFADYLLELNTARKPYDNVDVRRAINMAIDRQGIHKAILPSNPTLNQLFAKGFVGYDAALDKKNLYDVAKAKKLIDKAGATGASLNILYPTADAYPELATIVQNQLGAIGLKVTIQGIPGAQAVSTWKGGSYDGYVGAFSGSPDPATQLNVWIVTDNFAGPSALPAGLLDKAAVAKDLPFGSKQRDAAYQDISGMLVDSPIHIPLLQYSTAFVSAPKVLNMDKVENAGVISWSDFSYAGIAAGKA